jgi:hypothetical protein
VRASFAILPALLAAGCTHEAEVNRVQGPDGTSWLAVSCSGDMEVCWRGAAEACPHGYSVGDSHAVSATYGYFGSKGGYVGSTFGGDMLIQCNGSPAGSSVEYDRVQEERIAGPEPQADLSTCRQAYKHVGELGSEWVRLHPDRKPVAQPTRLEFVAVCRDLPEDAQICLQVPYRASHRSECTETIGSLDHRSQRRIDALFLRADDD